MIILLLKTTSDFFAVMHRLFIGEIVKPSRFTDKIRKINAMKKIYWKNINEQFDLFLQESYLLGLNNLEKGPYKIYHKVG